MTFYKFLNEDGRAFFSRAKWHLPTDKPGKWMPKLRGPLIPCEKGYHLCRESDLLTWLGPVLYEAEYEGELIETNDKVVVRKARLLKKVETWNDRTARLFACDCAERALTKEREAGHKTDERSWKAVEVARAFANGEATAGELAAASAAAWVVWTAAWTPSATWSATSSATWVAEAAWGAARRVVLAPPRGVVSGVAWPVELEWQTTRLMEYLEGKRT